MVHSKCIVPSQPGEVSGGCSHRDTQQQGQCDSLCAKADSVCGLGQVGVPAREGGGFWQ